LINFSTSFVPGLSHPFALAGGITPRYRTVRGVGLLLTVLLHAVGIWLLVNRASSPPLPSAGGAEVISYLMPLSEKAATTLPQDSPPPLAPLAPSASSASLPEPLPAAVKQPKKKVRSTQLLRHLAAKSKPPSLVTAPEVLASTSEQHTTDAIPADDFSARLDANRKRRAEAQADNPATAEASPESTSQSVNQIARDNIAFSQRGNQNAEGNQQGGVFQLREVRLNRAEFMFRGWNNNFRRNSSQLVTVDQGAEADIETAVVKRMITLIRAHKTGEFVWKSRGLGKYITLNADPAYENRLEAFLLKEFFPTYPGLASR
jgi:hypothetical protein